MMTTVFLISLIAIGLFFGFKYLTGKNKTRDEKSAMEKISGTIVNEAKRNLNDLAEGMRDTETVKKELLQAIEKNMKDLRVNYTKHFENLLRSKETYKEIQEKTSKRIENLKSKIRGLKEQFNNTNEEKYKTQAEDTVRILIEATRILTNSTNKIAKAEEDIEKSKNAYQISIIRLEEKRAEISSMMCSEVVSQSYVRDIERELKEKIKINDIQSKSIDLIDGREEEAPIISMDEVKSVYEQI